MAEGAAGEEADRESGRCRRRAGKRLNKMTSQEIGKSFVSGDR